jgi:hypothetical protein
VCSTHVHEGACVGDGHGNDDEGPTDFHTREALH